MNALSRKLWVLLAVVFGAWLLSHGNNPPTKQAQRQTVAPAPLMMASSPAPRTPAAKPSVERYYRIVETPNGFAPVIELKVDPASRWKSPAKIVSPQFPKDFAGAVQVTSGVASVGCTPLNANHGSAGKVQGDGSLVYENAFDGCDVTYRCEAYKTEEFITVNDANAPTRWTWELDTHGLTPRLTPASTIELCDEQKVPRLRINAPEGKDADGKVLNVGERLKLSLDGTKVTLAADLEGFALPVVIDPSWSSTGSMAAARYLHTATLMGNGTVLVAGGQGPSGALNSSELYDPATGTWSSTKGPLLTARNTHTAVRLGNGNVLVAGGIGMLGAALNSSELYDPVAGTWSPTTGSMATARYYHTATLLGDAKVLVVGGTLNGPVTNSSELYDPITSTWSATTGPLVAARYSHTATLLGNGMVIVAGGVQSTALISSELYDPIVGTWSSTGPMAAARFGHTASLLGSGMVLVAGGDSTSALNSSELYSPVTGTWSATAGLLTTARVSHTATLLGNGMVLATGGDISIALTSAELFDPVATTWSSTASLAVARTSHTATLLDNGMVLATGGQGTTGVALASCELFDRSTSPTISISGSPQIVMDGQAVAFASTTINPDADVLTYIWNFGDGTTSSDPNPAHTYVAAGIYTASVTITGTSLIGAPFSITSNSVTIHVYSIADLPVAEFVTSALNGYVGSPVGFDATFSTDPRNNIVSYTWDFGDGSPLGSGQAISRIYQAPGTYTVTLTITDGIGLSASTSLTMVILPASDAGLASSNIAYSVNWNRSTTNADSLNLSAQVNVGTTPVTSTTPLSLGIVGQTFTGTSGTKLSLPLSKQSGPQGKWQVKPVTKKGTPKGTYTLKATVKHASLGLAFALAGVTGTKSASAKIPVNLGIGASNFASSITSQFRFGNNGAKASGGGSGPK